MPHRLNHRCGAYCAVEPPSITSPAPVIKPASSEARKNDALGDVFGHSEPADRMPRHGLLTHRLDIVAA